MMVILVRSFRLPEEKWLSEEADMGMERFQADKRQLIKLWELCGNGEQISLSVFPGPSCPSRGLAGDLGVWHGDV